MKTRSLCTALFVVLVGMAQAQTTVHDSLATPVDTLAVQDSVRVRFMEGMGTLLAMPDSGSALHSARWEWTDDKLVEDVLWTVPGLYSTSLGEAGKPTRVYYQGLDSRYLNFSLDGAPVADPVTGEINLADLQLEFLESFEFLPSGLFAPGGVATLNAVSRQYNSPRPMTKLRFVQKPSETLLTDALFTQNVSRGANLTMGVQRHTSRGRYKNGALDGWNTRLRLRYNISPAFNVFLQHTYTADQNGMNGGVDRSITPDPFDQNQALVQTESGWETVYRTNWAAAAVIRLLSDSLSLTHAQLYSSSFERIFDDGGDDFHTVNVHDKDTYSMRGARVFQRLVFDGIDAAAGMQTEEISITPTARMNLSSENVMRFYGSASIAPVHQLAVTLGLQNESRGSLSASSWSAGARMVVSPFSLYATYENAGHIPTIQERYAADSLFTTVAPLGKESRRSITGGIDLDLGGNSSVTFSLFQHHIEQAVVFRATATAFGTPAIAILNIPSVESSGLISSATLHSNGWEFLGVASLTNYKEEDTVRTPLPDVYLKGELSYRRVLLKDALDIRLGLRATFLNREQGTTYSPQFHAYTLQNVVTLGRTTILDAFLVVQIGDAKISLSWENALDADYMLVPFYPMSARHVQLGVNWVWVD